MDITCTFLIYLTDIIEVGCKIYLKGMHMTDVEEQAKNGIKFITRGTYYLHDVLVGIHVCLSKKVLVHSQTEIIMERSCMWPPIPLVVIPPNHRTTM